MLSPVAMDSLDSPKNSPLQSDHAVPRKRVKLYKLDNVGAWDDKGTGYIDLTPLESESGNAHDILVHVVDEKTNATLLSNPVTFRETYHKQQETLIVWHTVDGEDLALSFLEKESCDEMWNRINEAQKLQRMHQSEHGPGPDDGQFTSEGDYEYGVSDSMSDFTEDVVSSSAGNQYSVALPEPSHGNLQRIHDIINELVNPQNELDFTRLVYLRDGVLNAVIKWDYIHKLLPFLEEFEDLDQTEDLYMLADIFRGVLFLNEAMFYKVVVKSDLWKTVIGILEYDKAYKGKQSFRDMFEHQIHFKELIPFNNDVLTQRIHEIYRLCFLRDVALARFLDESNFNTLQAIISEYQNTILHHFFDNPHLLEHVVQLMKSDDENERLDAMRFLNELSSFTKNVPFHAKLSFFRMLGDVGLPDAFEYILEQDNIQLRLSGMQMLLMVHENEPPLLRSWNLQQLKRKNPKPLLQLVIHQFLRETDIGLINQMYDIIRATLDISLGMDDDGPGHTSILNPQFQHELEAEEFIILFYDSMLLENLMTPILQLNKANFRSLKGKEVVVLDSVHSARCHYCCDLLAFLIRCHGHRIQLKLVNSELLTKCGWLCKAREPHIRAAALRVFRACMAQDDKDKESYAPLLSRANVFAAIMEMFLEVKNRYNLINSACIEFFEYIRRENRKELIRFFVENYRKQIDDIQYVKTFRDLILKYEQNLDAASMAAQTDENSVSKDTSAGRSVGDGRGVGPQQRAWQSSLDSHEEAYFNVSEDEDDEEEKDASDTTHELNTTAVATPPKPALPPMQRPKSPPSALFGLSTTVARSPNRSPSRSLSPPPNLSPARSMPFARDTSPRSPIVLPPKVSMSGPPPPLMFGKANAAIIGSSSSATSTNGSGAAASVTPGAASRKSPQIGIVIKSTSLSSVNKTPLVDYVDDDEEDGEVHHINGASPSEVGADLKASADGSDAQAAESGAACRRNSKRGREDGDGDTFMGDTGDNAEGGTAAAMDIDGPEYRPEVKKQRRDG